MTIIKNCGLKTIGDVAAAAAHGAEFVGFVHCEKSPRHLSLEAIRPLLDYARPLRTVLVTVNPDEALLDATITRLRPDYLQVHGVDVVRAQFIAAATRLPLIIGVAITSAADIATAQALEPYAAHLLLDAKESGSGVAFDWSLLQDVQFQKPWFLAGGLNAANVAEAIRITGAPMVDVSSGIEASPGRKSAEKIAAFNAAVLNASA